MSSPKQNARHQMKREGDVCLSRKKLLEMTPDDMDDYIEWATFFREGGITEKELRLLKDQRRKITNRVYARNSRSRKHQELEILIERNNELHERVTQLEEEMKKMMRKLGSFQPQIQFSPPPLLPTPSSTTTTSPSPAQSTHPSFILRQEHIFYEPLQPLSFEL